MHRIIHAILALLDLDFGRAADADHRDAARELGQTLLQLLTVVVRGGFLDLRLDLGHAGFDVGLLATAQYEKCECVYEPWQGLQSNKRLRPCHCGLRSSDPDQSKGKLFLQCSWDRVRRKKDYDRAIADYNQAIELNPKKESVLYFNRGDSRYLRGDYDGAIADLDRAIQLNPKFASAYKDRGNAYSEKKEHNRAIADYDQAI
jgi:tetratricopeptide (TPR) repeat protein